MACAIAYQTHSLIGPINVSAVSVEEKSKMVSDPALWKLIPAEKPPVAGMSIKYWPDTFADGSVAVVPLVMI